MEHITTYLDEKRFLTDAGQTIYIETGVIIQLTSPDILNCSGVGRDLRRGFTTIIKKLSKQPPEPDYEI